MRSKPAVCPLLILALGCNDYALEGLGASARVNGDEETFQPGDSAGMDSGEEPDSGSVLDTGDPCADSGALNPTVEVSAVEADPDAAEPVCTALGAVDWSMVVKWRTSLPAFAMGMVAAPNQGRAGASVFVDSDGTMIELDGRDGTVIQEVLLVVRTGSGDDGSMPVVADTDGDGDLDFAAPAWGLVNRVDTGTGVIFRFDSSGNDPQSEDDEVIQYADIDLDGSPEVILATAVFAADGTRLTEQATAQFTQMFVTDLNGDSFPEWVNGHGIWDPRDGSGTVFDASVGEGGSFYGAPVDVGGGSVAFSRDTSTWAVVEADGTVASTVSGAGGRLRGLVAVGDVDGDGSPDIVRIESQRTRVAVTEATGRETRSWAFDEGDLAGGGLSLADLDADGVYEIIVLRPSGLSVLSGLTGEVLAETTEVGTAARDSAPIIADIDGDGSAEIVALASSGTSAGEVVALGPATGRWARTRPIWNQLAYDAAAVRDDGTLVRFGTPGWLGLQAFRAQPGRDGELPDLAVSLSATDGEVCDEPAVLVRVGVRNIGSADAPAGALLRLSTWDGIARSVLVEQVLPDAIPPGKRVTLTWQGPLDAAGLIAEIVPVGQECDSLDDEAELGPW